MIGATLDRGPDAPPLYRQLGRELLALAESLGPGTRFPSERELIERYEVSRITVQQALGDLVRAGHLLRQQGRGTFVSRPKVERPRAVMNSFTTDMRQKGLRPSSRLLGHQRQPATARLAAMLGLTSEATPSGSEVVADGVRGTGDGVRGTGEVLVLERLMFADDEPMAIHQTFLRADLCGDVVERHLDLLRAGGSLYDLLESYAHIRLTDADETVEAAAATTHTAPKLGLELGDPVLWIVRHTFTDDGTPIEVSEMTYRGDRYRLGLHTSRGADR